MLRLGIVGSDSSHAIAYATLANVERSAGDAVRVVALWGGEPERTQAVAEAGQIPSIVAAPMEMLPLVDAVLVVDRHGDLHADHALPFITRGVPVFVDKPLAISLADCHRMIGAARKAGGALTSFSGLRYAEATTMLAGQADALGDIRAAELAGPCQFASEYGGPFFYATHLIELAHRLIGEETTTVRASQSGQTVMAELIWRNDAVANLAFLGDAAYHFHAALFGTSGMAAAEIPVGDEIYAASLLVMLEMIRTGVWPLSAEQLIRPIATIHAIQQSLASRGQPVSIANLIAETVNGESAE